MHNATVRRIIRAYDDPIVRAYCWGRFGILRQRFLEEIGQYLPDQGVVLDIGCGFGLFSLYYASMGPRRLVRGLDSNERRIGMARRAARQLGLGNALYEAGDARDFKGDGQVSLPPGGRLLVKDVDDRPAAKRWFTWVLDRAMAPTTPVHYWSADALTRALVAAGFGVHRHLMVDWLPYPHVLYVCEARG